MGDHQVEKSDGALSLFRQALSGDQDNLASGPLRRAIPLLAIPMVLEMATEGLFSICDVYFVGKLGPDSVASVGLTESLLSLVYSVAFGIAMPGGALVARRIGEKDRQGAGVVAAQAIILAIGIGLLLALSGLASKALLTLMGAAPSTLEVGHSYTAVALFSSPWIVLLFTCSAVFRGAGDARRSMRAMWLANGLNLILDPLLIFGLGPIPAMGVTGASVATTCGRATGVAYLLFHLWQGKQVPIRGAMKWVGNVAAKLIRRSIGGVGQHLVETGCWVIMARLVADLGKEAMAGYTIGTRLCMFMLLPIWGFSNATSTLVGQSLGAKNPARAERAVWLSGLYCTPILAGVSIAFTMAPHWFISFFTTDPQVIEPTAAALWVVGFGFVFYGWQMVTQQAFNGAGDTTTPALINVACLWCLQIPLGYVLAHRLGYGLPGIFAAAGICYSLAALIGVGLVRRGRWKALSV